MKKILLLILLCCIGMAGCSQNSLHNNGATPWAKYYGGNPSCKYDCSEIKVKTDYSNVIAIIKQYDEVVRHAYIAPHSSYTFSIPNGTYKVFFYYGNKWNPNKRMETKDGYIWGGFEEYDYFQKDDHSQSLHNQILTYSLITQQNGNFQTKPSSQKEAL